MEPWSTPALTFFDGENCPLRTTHCFLSFKKSRKGFSKFPDIIFWVSLKMTHTLSNACDTRNTPLTLGPSSKELYISWVIDNSWLIQVSPGLKPDWLVEIGLFSIENFQYLLVPFFVNRNDITLFPFRWKNTSFMALIENYF